jgi:4-hydroxy-tetrahydrodipicolinate synthase
MITTPLWTAVVTPMNEFAEIDYESFESVLREQESAGNGILVLGSTGEGLNLSLKEKQKVVNFAKGLNMQVPVMAGLGGFQLDAQIELLKYCDRVGVDAFLLVNPIYAKPGKEGQYTWFKSLMAKTSTPCMIYNVPSRTGIRMNPEVPARLYREFPHYLGLKEASGSVTDFAAFRECEPAAPLYCGDDNLIKDFVKMGAVGHVSVAANTWPAQTKKYLEIALSGDYEALFSEWEACANLLFDAPSPTPVKSLLFHKGWINSDQVRLPLVREDLQSDTEEALIEADRKLNEWFEGT